MTQQTQANDVGVVLELTITKESDGTALDISSATTRQILLKPPRGGATVTKTATLSGAGTDGKMRYVTEAGVLSAAGTWKIQGRVVIGSLDVHTSVEDFAVIGNL